MTAAPGKGWASWEKKCAVWQGQAVERLHVACLVSRTAAESRQQRWHLLDDSPIAPPPRRAGFSVMTSRPGCAQRSMFNTHSRLRLLACDIDFHAFPIMSCIVPFFLHHCFFFFFASRVVRGMCIIMMCVYLSIVMDYE
ncbi:hypothetical protein BGZ57DRAFT_81100 [Hyaloscypha finlandica]|nr:hypothetical protein BGZ57DRAFT_81100 [Hyaloscypha finlandica]